MPDEPSSPEPTSLPEPGPLPSALGDPIEPAAPTEPATPAAPTELATSAAPTELATPAAPTEPAAPVTPTEPATPTDPPGRVASPPAAPLYKGEPLDSERGPGLGCFWAQVIILGALLIITPLTVALSFPEWVSAALLILTLILLLFAGQTVIFLLRLVAADRRTRRTPQSATARKTVGMLEDEATQQTEPIPTEPSADEPPTSPS